jgi:RNA polymerase sigma factor (TIGR02999 family)
VSTQEASEVTRLLRDAGSPEAADRLYRLVYDELRAVAVKRLAAERPDHTLTPTALVHEAYMRLVDQDRVEWRGRAHFFAIAARMMRRILVDHARRKRAASRGGGKVHVTLGNASASHGGDDPGITDLLALHEALDRLAALDERQASVVELRFFGGLEINEVAVALDVSASTVKRDWAFAQAWLQAELAA